MKSRILPILNAIGCLALTGVVLLQWTKERALEASLDVRLHELAEAKDQAASEVQRSADLERDILALKESLEATQKAAETTQLALAERGAKATANADEITAAREKIATWQAAIAGRDEKIRELDTELAATRGRLEAAVARLKTAGGR